MKIKVRFVTIHFSNTDWLQFPIKDEKDLLYILENYRNESITKLVDSDNNIHYINMKKVTNIIDSKIVR